MNRHRRLAQALLLATCAALVGCESSPTPPDSSTEPAVAAPRRPLPTYAAAAAAYNQRILPLDRLIARRGGRAPEQGRDASADHAKRGPP